MWVHVFLGNPAGLVQSLQAPQGLPQGDSGLEAELAQYAPSVVQGGGIWEIQTLLLSGQWLANRAVFWVMRQGLAEVKPQLTDIRPWVPYSIPSTHKVAHTLCNSSSRASDDLFRLSQTPATDLLHSLLGRQKYLYPRE